MASIIAIVLIFVGLVFYVLLRMCLPYGIYRIMRVDRGRRSLSKVDLEKLPCYDYVAKENGSNPLDCAICLENFTIGDKCRLLPICEHNFHAQCVDQWLLRNSICPICRSMVGSHSGDKVVIGNNGRESIESGSSRNVVIELRENIPTLEVESQEH
ncbi:putative transcription factor C2H2 family [Medicago truncatula]|uniref:RING-type E3 ubiquitin transferase n=1 Tax=Medicago truncatula TaxID=3880 RepID=A0A072U582_MEDTR|nr:putative RING-H2 finger protein ATL37 [Medicago truncatula]KEH24869.1 anaphase-promoting complex subunit 11 RING-H2 finger protein [Medicago truncatula]RHN49851.1 putative transcription factor C2H2 family [Medicago truncatula]